MANDMVTPQDLAHIPGAPFVDAEVDAAVAAIRAAAQWHIAPVRIDTAVPLDVVWAETTLRLPTRRLVTVDQVRNADTAEVIDPARYRVSHARARVQRRGGYWPAGYEAVEVDMTHGFDECPADLLPLIGQYALQARRDSTVKSVQVDDALVSYGSTTSAAPSSSALSGSAVLARYSLPEWPGMA